ncbi:MAG: tetratricopeptide repeat protein [Elusimicrobiota bacterium]
MNSSSKTNMDLETGKRYANAGEHSRALAVFLEMLAEAPDAVSVHLEIGKIHYAQEQYAAAAEELAREIAVNPASGHAFLLLGKSRGKLGEPDGALAAYRKAIECDPGLSGAYFEMGKIYHGMKQYGAALTSYDREREGCAGEAMREMLHEALVNAAQECLRVGDRENAHAAIEQLERQGALPLGMHEKLGNLYVMLGDYEKALKETMAEISVSPNHAGAIHLLDRILEQRSRGEGWGVLSRVLEADPGKYAAVVRRMLTIAQRCNNAGDHARALVITGLLLPLKEALSCSEKNQLLCEQEIAQGKTMVVARVCRLSVQVTTKCNLRCRMCSVVTRPAQDISQKVRDELLAIMPFVRDVYWLGGEVFLYPDFDMLLSAGVRNGVRQNIVTNGLLIDETIAVKLIENNISLTFSIDGTTKEVYEYIRNGASFETLQEKLLMMNTLKANIRPGYAMDICMVIMRSNCHQIINFVSFAQKHGFSIVRYQYMYSPEIIPEEDIFTINRDDILLQRVYADLAVAKAMCEQENIQFSHNLPHDLFVDYSVRGGAIDDTRGNTTKKDSPGSFGPNCYAPWSHVSIAADGTVMPQSHCLCGNSVGNLNTESLDAIWNGNNMMRYREALVSGGIEKICTLKKYFPQIPYEVLAR